MVDKLVFATGDYFPHYAIFHKNRHGICGHIRCWNTERRKLGIIIDSSSQVLGSCGLVSIQNKELLFLFVFCFYRNEVNRSEFFIP